MIGAGDSQCVAFGAGVVDPGPVSEMAGASSCLNSAVTEPLADVSITHYSHVVPDRFTTELGINTSGAAIDWAVRRLGYSRPPRTRGRRRAAAAADAPLARPTRASWRRSSCPTSATASATTRRCAAPSSASRCATTARRWPTRVLEGIAFGVHGALAELEAAGSPVDELRVAGGGGRLPVLSQIKADVLCRPVLALRADAAAIGTALLSGRAAGLGEEAAAAVAAVLAAARRYEPTAGADRLSLRLEWYERTRAAQAVREDWSGG